MASAIGLRSVFHYMATVRNNPEEYQKLLDNEALRKEGLKNEPFLQSCLSQGQYIPVLDRIWAERDLKIRVEWLRSHEKDLDVILLLEQACAEVENNLTEETVNVVAQPLLRIASLRLTQDVTCLTLLSEEYVKESQFNLEGLMQESQKIREENTRLSALIINLKGQVQSNSQASEEMLRLALAIKDKIDKNDELSSKISEKMSALLEKEKQMTLFHFDSFLIKKIGHLLAARYSQGARSRTEERPIKDRNVSIRPNSDDVLLKALERSTQITLPKPDWLLGELLHPENPFYGTKIGLKIAEDEVLKRQAFAVNMIKEMRFQRAVDSLGVD